MAVQHRPRPLPRKRGLFDHNCPGCGRFVRWALTFCTGCSWQGKPIENIEWVEFLMQPGKDGRNYGYRFR